MQGEDMRVVSVIASHVKQSVSCKVTLLSQGIFFTSPLCMTILTWWGPQNHVDLMLSTRVHSKVVPSFLHQLTVAGSDLPSDFMWQI